MLFQSPVWRKAKIKQLRITRRLKAKAIELPACNHLISLEVEGDEEATVKPRKLARPEAAAAIGWMECKDKSEKTWATTSPKSAPCDWKFHIFPFFPAELDIYAQGSTAQRTGDSRWHKEQPKDGVQ